MSRDNGGVNAAVAVSPNQHVENEHAKTVFDDTKPFSKNPELDTLEEEERDIGSDERAAQSKLKSLETKLIDFNKLIWKDNPRLPEDLDLAAMKSSLYARGFKANHPIVVSKKKNGFLVLCGNRRTEALKAIQEEDAERFAEILPDGKIPAVVHEGLTVEEETNIRIDHDKSEDRKPLSQWGEFLAVKQLLRAGYGQKNIALKLGKITPAGKPKRSWVQQRANLARLPEFVQKEMEIRMRKLPAEHERNTLNVDWSTIPLRWEHIPQLFTAANEDFDADFRTVFRDGKGERFQNLWNDLHKQQDDVPVRRALTPKAMEEQAKQCQSRLLAEVLLTVAARPLTKDENGEPVFGDLRQLDSKIAECEEKAE